MGHLAKLWLSNEPANLAARLAGKTRPACSDFDYPDQETGVKAPAWNPDGTANCTFKGEVTDGMGDGRALADDDGLQVAAAGSVVAPGFFSVANTNEAFAAGNAELEAGRAGTSYRWSAKLPAILACALQTVERDPLLEQMMAEEREREEAKARGEVIASGAVSSAAGFQGPAARSRSARRPQARPPARREEVSRPTPPAATASCGRFSVAETVEAHRPRCNPHSHEDVRRSCFTRRKEVFHEELLERNPSIEIIRKD